MIPSEVKQQSCHLGPCSWMGSILHLHWITQAKLSDPVFVRGRSIILASMRRGGGEAHGPPGGKAWDRAADLCHPGQAAGNHLHWDSKWEYSRLSCSGREGWDRGPRNPEQVRQVQRLSNLKHVMVSSDCSGNVFVMEYDQQSAKMELGKLGS